MKLNFKLPFLNKSIQKAMDFKRLSSLLGREITSTAQITTEDWDRINASLPDSSGANSGAENNKPPKEGEGGENGSGPESTDNNANSEVLAAIAALSDKFGGIESKVSSIESRLKKVEGSDGAAPTGTPPVDGGKPAVNAWDDANASWNVKAKEQGV